MNILKKINKLRMDRNWSVYRLSLESGIPQSTITNMFNRETLPSIATLEMLCRAFGISLSEFFAEEDKDLTPDSEELLRKIQMLSESERQVLCDLITLFEQRKKG